MGGEHRGRRAAQYQETQGTGGDRTQRQPARRRHTGRRQPVQRQAQQQDHQQAEGDRHRIGPEHIAGDEYGEVLAGRQVRQQQAATGRRHLRGHHRQQPDRGHLVDAMRLAGKHQIGDQHPASQCHGHIQPPEAECQGQHRRAPARQAEQQQAVDQRGQAHGDGADRHRDGGVGEDLAGLVEEQQPAGGIEPGEQAEQQHSEQPEAFGEDVQSRKLPGEGGQSEGQHASAHGHGEPVGGELADDLQGAVELAEGSEGLRWDSGEKRHGRAPEREGPQAKSARLSLKMNDYEILNHWIDKALPARGRQRPGIRAWPRARPD